MKKIAFYSAILLFALLTTNALIAQTGTISGTVFLDNNSDGVFDASESGMMDIQVTLSDVAGNQSTTTTDSDGFYSFENLGDAMYSVYITQWALGIEPSTSASQDVNITAGNSDVNVDFGFMVAGTGNCTLSIMNNLVLDANCGEANGSISVTVDGGAEPYEIFLNGDLISNETSNEVTVSDLGAGIYAITFNDSDNCEVSINNEVLQTGEPQFEIATVNADCGSNNGLAFINIDDDTGSGDFSVFSENGEVNGLEISGLVEGTYQASLMDALCGEFPFTIEIGCDQTEPSAGDNNPPCVDTLFFCTPPLASVEFCFPTDCDPDGDNIAISEHTGSLFGCSIHIDTDLCFTYTPLPAFLGEDFLEVTVCDDSPEQLCSTSQFYFTVGPDCGPSAVEDEYTVQGGQSTDLMVLENDDHPLGIGYSITEATDGFNGTVEIDPTGTYLIYTPNDDFAGGDSFNYTLCDDEGNCVNALVVVTVEGEVVTTNCEADAGTLTPPDELCIGLDESIAAPTLEGGNGMSGFVYVYVLTTDANPNDNILYDIVSLNTTGSFDFSTIDSGAGTYNIHGMNFEGTLLDLVDFNPVSGEEVLNAIAAESICADLIVPGYEITVAENCNEVLCEDTQYFCGEPQVPQDICFSFCDLLGQGAAIDSISSTYTNCSVTLLSDTCVTYVAVPGYFGLDSVIVYSCTPLACDTSWAYINVGCQFPVALDDEVEASPGLPLFINVLANDSEPCNDGNEGLTVTILDEPENGFAASTEDGVDYVVDEDFEGVDEFTYVVCNDCLQPLCDTATVVILVGDDVTPPDEEEELSVQPDIVSTPMNMPIDVDVLANDSGGLTVIEVGDAQNGLVLLDNGVVTYTPNGGYVGDDFFDYTACNDDGECETTFVQVTVFDESENQAPVANNDAIEVAAGSTTEIDVLANDTDLENNAFTITEVTNDSDCGEATINDDGTAIIFVAEEDCEENITINYVICEDEEADNCDEAELVIAVGTMLENTAPVAVNDTVFVNDFEGQLVNAQENDSDAQGDNLTYTTVSGPECAEGYEMNADGFTIYDAADPEDCPEDLVMYVVCDDAEVALCDTAFIYFVLDSTLIEPPTPPGGINAEDDEVDVAFNGEVDINLYDNDESPEQFIITIMSGPENGTAEVNNNGTEDVSINYMPNMNFSGTDIIEYELCVDGECDTAIITITVDVACSFDIPNGISPNNDGIMDEFSIEGIEDCFPEERELVIFNRWGNEVYRKLNFGDADSWDGTWENEPVPDGTYFYILTAKGSDELESIDVAGYLEVYR